MSTDLTGDLDVALEQLHGGERIPTILARYPGQAKALALLLDAAVVLNAIRPVEMPAPEALWADRNDFLAEIAHLQAQPVSPGILVRLQEWIALQIPQNPLQRKEQRRMSTLLVKATLIFSMAFGSAGGAAALAASSLPDSPLYPAKLALEQTRLRTATGPAEQAELHMTLAQVRVREMERQVLAGKVLDETTVLRLSTHLDQALQLAGQLPDDSLASFLTQARGTIQNQEQTLKQVRAQAADPAQEPLDQASGLLSQARQVVEAGLEDPNTIRRRTTKSRPGEAPPQPTVVPVPGGNPDCPTGDCEPVGDEHQYGPQPDQPEPGQPGGNPDCPTGDCEPVGDQNQYGPQPDQPGPGTPGGNPECPNDDCEPAGDEHQYGPQPDQPGPGEPDGNPDCPTDDCEPVGDQHHYGSQSDELSPGEPGGNPECPTDGCEPVGDEHQLGPQPDQPGPGEPSGNPDCPAGDCEPIGDKHHNGPQPAQPAEEDAEPPPDPSPPDDHGGERDDGGKKH
jgi:hypothetical protein